MQRSLPSYVLVTAARNEEAYIDATIRSVVAQTIRPRRWVIVSDGSTDRTDEIVKRYASQHDWIELIRKPERSDRHFAAKAHCVNDAYEHLRAMDFELFGNLDADVSFDPDYYEFLLGKFAESPDLGVAGTPYLEGANGQMGRSSAHEFTNLKHVSGQCQLFRRQCFEAVGGYVPIKGGAIDWVAVTTARMKGWETRSFLEKTFFHHRKMGSAGSSVLRSHFHYGRKAYYVGGHPVWELLRGVFQMRKAPFVLGGASFIAGFCWAWVTRMERPVPAELIRFHQAEQMARLRQVIGRLRGRI